MNGVQARKIISYVVMPEIIPRIRALLRRSFGHIPFLMAHIYNLVRLIPNGHAYLDHRNIGRFGLRMVIAEAANNLVISRKNMDQVAVFGLLLAAIVIMFVQIALIAYAALMQPAMAASLTSLFSTPQPSAAPLTDVAFMLLDHVFGVPNLFCATVASGPGVCTNVMPSGLPLPFHVALHDLFKFYSMGLLIVGALIFLYYVLVVVAETAVSGTPFGSRFQHIWVPIRLVVALGLLIPINYGLNSGQYIVLYAAKFGSSFATNTWINFNDKVTTGSSGSTVFGALGGANPIGERQNLLSKPIAQDVSSLIQFMSIVRSCRYAYWRTDPDRNYFTNTPPAPVIPNLYELDNRKMGAWFVKSPNPQINTSASAANTSLRLVPGTTFQNAIDFYGKGATIVFVFGEEQSTTASGAASSNYPGNIAPRCGSVRVPILSYQPAGATQNAATRVQELYFELIKLLWFGAGGSSNPTLTAQAGFAYNLLRLSDRLIELKIDSEDTSSSASASWQCSPQLNYTNIAAPACKTEHNTARDKQEIINAFNAAIEAEIRTIWNNYNTTSTSNSNVDLAYTNQMKDRGWGGAGIWYNTIANINGAFIDAVMNVPAGLQYPLVMEEARTANQNAKNTGNISPFDLFNPRTGDSTTAKFSGPNDSAIAEYLNAAYLFWNEGGNNQADTDIASSNSDFRNMISTLFGVKGLMSMRGDNSSIHPMAQLTGLGKTLVNSAVLSISGSVILSLSQGFVGNLAGFASGILSNVAMLGLTAGLVLFYVLPFLPFLYFYFAVGTWVMSIFEAMVGAPLWALAHLRIDGEGLPGDGARDGYFLILEIFLRPVLSVFGLIAAMVIFAAQVRVLNVIWDIVVANLTGFAGPVTQVGAIDIPRDSLDQFFYTMLYAVIVYMLAIASFKLIDRIPDGILRWMGSSSSSYSDINPDATEGLTRYVSQSGLVMGEQITGAVRTTSKQAGGLLVETLKGGS